MDGPMINVCVMGAWGTGKTALLSRFSDGFFEEETLTTIGTDSCHVTYEVDPTSGKCRRQRPFRIADDRYTGRLLVRCWDTAGQERFIALSRSYIRQGSMYVVCCEGRVPLQEQCRFWMDEIRMCGVPPYKVVIVLTKTDLHDEAVKITMHSAYQDLVQGSTLDASYFETSAKDNVGVVELFDWIAQNGIHSNRRIMPALNQKPRLRGCC